MDSEFGTCLEVENALAVKQSASKADKATGLACSDHLVPFLPDPEKRYGRVFHRKQAYTPIARLGQPTYKGFTSVDKPNKTA